MSKSKGNRLRFSKEEDEKLIHEVSIHSALYDAKNKLYKDQNVRDNIWNEVSKNVQKSVEDCKKRWKSLKDVYWKKKKEYQQGTGSSARSSSKWEHMDALAFLETTEKFRKTSNNSNVIIDEENFVRSPEGEDENMFTHENDEKQEKVTQELQNKNTREMQQDDIQEMQEDDTREMSENNSEETQSAKIANLKRSSEKLSTDYQKKKRKTTTEKIFDTLSKGREDRTKLMTKIESVISEESGKPHPLKLFFASMAETVMGFPPALAVRVKMKVLQVITELELENCGEQHSSTYPSSA